jgi:hypothetical protein
MDSGIFQESATAITARYSFVRMPLRQHGPRQAIEHWCGSRSSPLLQNPRSPTWADALRRITMPEERKNKSSKSSRRQPQGLPVMRQNVAGIDLGSARHWVCAPTVDGSGREIADFGEHARCRRLGHGGALAAPQRNSPRRVLPEDCATGPAAILRCLPPPESWPLSFTACSDGGNPKLTKARRRTKSAIGQQLIRNLGAKAKELGYQLTSVTA